MQTKLILALACCFPFPAGAQVTVTGTWKADDVAFPPWTFVLKADGNKLSGAVSQGRSDPASSTVTTLVQAVEITEGAIDGNRLSFKVNALNGNTIAFSGVVNGDTITFTREVVSGSSGLNGIFGAKGASSFTAKFASTSTEIQAPQAAAALVSSSSVNTGVRVVFLGTGTPVVDPDRSGPAVAVVAGGKSYLMRPGVVRRASSAARR